MLVFSNRTKVPSHLHIYPRDWWAQKCAALERGGGRMKGSTWWSNWEDNDFSMWC